MLVSIMHVELAGAKCWCVFLEQVDFLLHLFSNPPKKNKDEKLKNDIFSIPFLSQLRVCRLGSLHNRVDAVVKLFL